MKVFSSELLQNGTVLVNRHVKGCNEIRLYKGLTIDKLVYTYDHKLKEYKNNRLRLQNSVSQ